MSAWCPNYGDSEDVAYHEADRDLRHGLTGMIVIKMISNDYCRGYILRWVRWKSNTKQENHVRIVKRFGWVKFNHASSLWVGPTDTV